MTIKITLNDKGNPPGKLAEAELHFSDGPLAGLRLLGWSAQAGPNGCQLLIKDGDTLTNSQTVATIVLAPNDSGSRHYGWGGFDCSGGLTLDLVLGSCSLVLQTGVW